MSKINNRDYFVAEVTRRDGNLTWNSDEVVPASVRHEVVVDAALQAEPLFFVAYMKLGNWLWGYGRTRDRAITHLTERYEEASES